MPSSTELRTSRRLRGNARALAATKGIPYLTALNALRSGDDSGGADRTIALQIAEVDGPGVAERFVARVIEGLGHTRNPFSDHDSELAGWREAGAYRDECVRERMFMLDAVSQATQCWVPELLLYAALNGTLLHAGARGALACWAQTLNDTEQWPDDAAARLAAAFPDGPDEEGVIYHLDGPNPEVGWHPDGPGADVPALLAVTGDASVYVLLSRVIDVVDGAVVQLRAGDSLGFEQLADVLVTYIRVCPDTEIRQQVDLVMAGCPTGWLLHGTPDKPAPTALPYRERMALLPVEPSGAFPARPPATSAGRKRLASAERQLGVVMDRLRDVGLRPYLAVDTEQGNKGGEAIGLFAELTGRRLLRISDIDDLLPDPAVRPLAGLPWVARIEDEQGWLVAELDVFDYYPDDPSGDDAWHRVAHAVEMVAQDVTAGRWRFTPQPHAILVP